MTRDNFNPKDFGIDLTREQLAKQLLTDFDECYCNKINHNLTIDELLLRPREALRFCDRVRRRFAYWDLPDDIILKTLVATVKDCFYAGDIDEEEEADEEEAGIIGLPDTDGKCIDGNCRLLPSWTSS